MKLLIFCYSLKGQTGSPIRALNIIEGLAEKIGAENIVLISSGYSEEVFNKFRCVDTKNDLFESLEDTIKSEGVDAFLSITHAHANKFAKICKRNKVKFFVDIHALRSLEVMESDVGFKEKIKIISNEGIRWFLGLIKADVIFAANHVLYKYLRFLLGKKVIDVCGITKINEHIIKENQSDKIKILYAGNLRKYQGIDLLLDSIELIEDNIFEFCILGDVGLDKKIEEKIKKVKSGGKKLDHLKSISYSGFQNFVNDFDVIVIPRPWSLTAYMALPQKLVEAMCLGKCIVATDILPHKILLEDCGILAKPNAKSFATAILKTRDKQYVLNRKKLTLKKASEVFNYDKQVSKIYDKLRNI